MEYNCPRCKHKLIKNIEKYLGDWPKENYVNCGNCGIHIPRIEVVFSVGLGKENSQ